MTRKRRLFALSIAATTLSVMGLSSVAEAVPTSSHSGANAVQTGVVRIDPNDPTIAYVTGNYKCPEGPAHLFVSVKQVADAHPDPKLKLEGSSSISSGWLERHPEQSEFTCDGTWHTGTWWIGLSEYGHGAIVPGTVYVQFCWDGADWHAYSEQFARAS
jgi:hypothetical protein